MNVQARHKPRPERKSHPKLRKDKKRSKISGKIDNENSAQILDFTHRNIRETDVADFAEIFDQYAIPQALFAATNCAMPLPGPHLNLSPNKMTLRQNLNNLSTIFQRFGPQK